MAKLREHLKEKRITQRAFADRVGVSKAYMSEIASGLKVPSLEVAVRIQRATDGDVAVESWIPEQVCFPTPRNQEDAA